MPLNLLRIKWPGSCQKVTLTKKGHEDSLGRLGRKVARRPMIGEELIGGGGS